MAAWARCYSLVNCAGAVPPLPLRHVDTTWKLRDTHALRERIAADAGLPLIVPQLG